jgi:predicted xylose isomerase-like sugar epimerase
MKAATLTTGRTSLAVAFLLSLVTVSPAYADSLTLMWDPNAEQVAGYAVYVGSSSGSLTQRYDVGNTTSFNWMNAVAGQQYCFAVTAYLDASTEGPKSTVVCGYSNQYPTLTKPANKTSTAGQPASLQLVGSDPDGQAVTYSASGLPPGLSLMSGTGFISGTPTTAGTYTVMASVSDGVLSSAAQSFTWSVSAAPAADTTAPTVSVIGPTSASTYASSALSVSLSGTANDNVGVTAVSWTSDRGGSGTATGTTSWSIGAIGLQVGTNVISVTARDAAGNQASDVLTVTYTAPDTTAPSVSIASPTAGSTYATASANMPLGGSASDNVGVTQVNWVNDRGGSGIASGTTNWSVSAVALQSGTNIITVTARDAAGNQSTDTLTVTYTPPDTAVPTVSILGPTSASSYAAASSALTLGGTASDNLGVTAVTWANDRGGSGFTSGTTSWSVASVTLQTGTNVITVTAQDAAGNKGTDVLTVTYSAPDTSAPAVIIMTPTVSTSYAVSLSSLSMGGTASDNVGVTQVTWANDRGGSGTASGTTSWSIPTIALQAGINVITVTARDAAGNQGATMLTVTYSASDSTVPAVSISGPTTMPSYVATSSSLSLGGVASDNVGVTQVSWVNDRGGSGTASGTTNWSVAAVALQGGTNVITVTAWDAAGNLSIDALTVTYSAPAPAPSPTPSIDLSGTLYASGRWMKALLSWNVVTGRYVDVYRNGSRLTRTTNDGSYTDSPRSSGPYTYYVCVTDTTVCSNTITLSQ